MTIYTDARTISTATSVISDERGPFADSSTISTTTEITTGELEYLHPTGFWGSFDDDDGVI